jgi:hypothetical protein
MRATNARGAKRGGENDRPLRQWELDARALRRASDEGMTGEDPVATRKTIGDDNRLGSTERILINPE